MERGGGRRIRQTHCVQPELKVRKAPDLLMHNGAIGGPIRSIEKIQRQPAAKKWRAIKAEKIGERKHQKSRRRGGKGVIFNTITISDGISMGTQGMKYSLVSREVIADSIETVSGCMGHDGIVALGGCDKNMPGCMIGLPSGS